MKLIDQRAETILNWLASVGGSTKLTNGAISEELSMRVSTTRIAESLSTLVDRGAITIERVAPHPKRNPSGRVIRIVENEVF